MPAKKVQMNALQSVLTLLGILIALSLIWIFFYSMNFSDSKNMVPGRGSACGGFVGKSCPIGLNCVYPKPNYPDQMGTCQ